MKTHTHTSLLIRSSLAFGLALALWSPVQSQSAEPAEGKTMMEGKMTDHCQDMMKQKQKMKEDMEAQDAELTKHVAEMNSAPQDKKVSLMADVVTQMVEQRVAMHAQKAKMDEEMTKHMMQHMQMGKGTMSECPMMKGMKGKHEHSAATHEEHQEDKN